MSTAFSPIGCVAFFERTSHIAPMLARRIGANIKAAREKRNGGKGEWALEAVAKRIEPKTTYQTLSRFENATRPLTINWVERIAKALEVDPMELLAPELLNQEKGESTEPRAIRLDEQVATEGARALATAATGDPDPDWGTVQAVSEVLQRLLALFSIHPEAAADVRVARPAINLAAQKFGREAH